VLVGIDVERELQLQRAFGNEVRHRDSKQCDLALTRMVGKCRVRERDSDVGEGARRRDRGALGRRSGHTCETGESNPHRDGPAGALLCPQPRRHAIGEMPERRLEQRIVGDATTERRLRADGPSSSSRLDLPRVGIVRE
jgi:hypothetical protein